MDIRLWLVVPCYNEEEVIEHTYDELEKLLLRLKEKKTISTDSKILFVDDGSVDKTWEKITDLHNRDRSSVAIRLSHNQGHQNALLAGMMYAMNYCDCIITLDADLQDDIEVIPELLSKFVQGNQIVYAVRKDRSKDSFFKRSSAQAFYKLMNVLGAETIYNHADYRLMSKKALKALSSYSEVNLFLRGIVPLIGMQSDVVYYERKERTAGQTKYPFNKMLRFAANGITSFSVKPLRVISIAGIICSGFSIIGLLYALISFFVGNVVPGWTAIVCSIWLLSGIQLLCIGVLGEYIGKIFSEVKQRPRYFIDDELNNEKDQ